MIFSYDLWGKNKIALYKLSNTVQSLNIINTRIPIIHYSFISCRMQECYVSSTWCMKGWRLVTLTCGWPSGWVVLSGWTRWTSGLLHLPCILWPHPPTRLPCAVVWRLSGILAAAETSVKGTVWIIYVIYSMYERYFLAETHIEVNLTLLLFDLIVKRFIRCDIILVSYLGFFFFGKY